VSFVGRNQEGGCPRVDFRGVSVKGGEYQEDTYKKNRMQGAHQGDEKRKQTVAFARDAGRIIFLRKLSYVDGE